MWSHLSKCGIGCDVMCLCELEVDLECPVLQDSGRLCQYSVLDLRNACLVCPAFLRTSLFPYPVLQVDRFDY